MSSSMIAWLNLQGSSPSRWHLATFPIITLFPHIREDEPLLSLHRETSTISLPFLSRKENCRPRYLKVDSLVYIHPYNSCYREEMNRSLMCNYLQYCACEDFRCMSCPRKQNFSLSTPLRESHRPESVTSDGVTYPSRFPTRFSDRAFCTW